MSRSPMCVAVLLISSLPAQEFIRGRATAFGASCGVRANAIYELFPAGTFDLDGSSGPSGAHCVTWTPNGLGSYRVLEGGAMLPYGSGTDTQASDGVSGPWPLGFSFAYPGGSGSTTAVVLDPAGYVYLESGVSGPGRCCSGAFALTDFLTSVPSFAVLGQNLNPGPAGAGRIWFDVSAVNTRQVAYFTWDSVAEGTNQAALNTCQLQLWDDGRCVMCWNGARNQVHDALVGWSAGGGQPQVGSADLSALPIDGGDGTVHAPMTIRAPPLPVPTLGIAYFLDLQERPSPMPTGALMIGTSATAIDLDFLGMPFCDLLTSSNLAVVPLLFSPFVALPSNPQLKGTQLTLQIAYLAPGVNALGVVTTNAVSLLYGGGTYPLPTGGVWVTADGLDSFDTDPSSGFWSIEHDQPSRPEIRRVTLDFAAATAGNARSQYFRVDAPGLRFDAGNSAVPGCSGTFRNGSDVTTGLIYAGTPASPCDPSAAQGWIGTNPIFPGQFRTLTFRFSDFQYGETFEFDCDTEGNCVAGYCMDGMIVTVEFADGSVVSGEFLPIPGSFGSGQVFF